MASPVFTKTKNERQLPAESFSGNPVELIKETKWTQDPIGIAKDGHIIWGPIKSEGNYWTACDVDVCNWSETKKGYAATLFHPYIVGCWGSGSSPNDIGQSCTSRPRICKS